MDPETTEEPAIELFTEDDYIVLDDCTEQAEAGDPQADHVTFTPITAPSNTSQRVRGKGKRGGVAKRQQQGAGVAPLLMKKQGAAARKMRAAKLKRARAKVAQAREVRMTQNRSLLDTAQHWGDSGGLHQEVWPSRTPLLTLPSQRYGAPEPVGYETRYGPSSALRSLRLEESPPAMPVPPPRGDLRQSLIQQRVRRLAGGDPLFSPEGPREPQGLFGPPSLSLGGSGPFPRPLSAPLSGGFGGFPRDRTRSYDNSDDLPNDLLFSRPVLDDPLFGPYRLTTPTSIPNRRPPIGSTVPLVKPVVSVAPVAKALLPAPANRSWRGKKKVVMKRLGFQAKKKVPPKAQVKATPPKTVPAKAVNAAPLKAGNTNPQKPAAVNTAPPKPPNTQKPPTVTNTQSPLAQSSSVLGSATLEEAVCNMATRIQETLSHPTLHTSTSSHATTPSPAVTDLLAKIDAGITSFVAASRQITDSLNSLSSLLKK